MPDWTKETVPVFAGYLDQVFDEFAAKVEGDYSELRLQVVGLLEKNIVDNDEQTRG